MQLFQCTDPTTRVSPAACRRAGFARRQGRGDAWHAGDAKLDYRERRHAPLVWSRPVSLGLLISFA